MKKQNILIIVSLIAGSLAFTGCSSKSEIITSSNNMVNYQKVDVFSDMYRLGVKEGCKTAKGYYEKDYFKYNTNSVYKEGWYAGMKQCRQKGKYLVAY